MSQCLPMKLEAAKRDALGPDKMSNSYDTSVFSSNFYLYKTFHDCDECLQDLEDYLEYKWNLNSITLIIFVSLSYVTVGVTLSYHKISHYYGRGHSQLP